jgi:PAS domain S-box-containing protein
MSASLALKPPSPGASAADTAVAALLLVDDHPANLAALEAILAPLGQRLVKASSGEEALRRVMQEDFAAILMDVRMSGIGGVEATALIRQRERSRRTPVLLLTAADADEREVLQAYAHGAVDFLRKPFAPEVLVSKVSVFVDLFLAREEVKWQARQRQAEALERAHQERINGLLMQAPVSIALWRGPEHVYELTNPAYERLVNKRGLLGRRARDVFPELEGQGVFELLDRAYATGEPQTVHELQARLDRLGNGALDPGYFTFTIIPVRDGEGRITGVMQVASEVTSQVNARKRVEALSAISAALTASLTVEEVIRVVVDQVHAATGAAASVAYLLSGDGQELRLAGARGIPPDGLAAMEALALEATLPLPEAVRTGKPLFLGPGDAVVERYPQLSTTGVPPEALRSVAALPLQAKDRVLGGIALSFDAPHALATPEQEFLLTVGGQCVTALERAWLYEREQAAAARAQAAEERLRAALSAAVVGTWHVDLGTGLDTRDASLNRILGLEARETTVPVSDFLARVHPEDQARVEAAVARAVQERGAFDEECRIVRPDGTVRWVKDRGTVLLGASGEPVGFTGAVADITRERRRQEGIAFLSEASAMLASSLDFSTTIQNVARAAVPRFSDWVSVYLQEAPGGPVELLAVHHEDPEKAECLRELHRRYPLAPDAPYGHPRVFRTGRAERLGEVTDEMRQRLATTPEQLALLRAVAAVSALSVPLFRQGRPFGVLAFGTSKSKRRYEDEDLAVAEEVGRRASVAIEHARLYRDAQTLAERLQQSEQQFRALAESIPHLVWTAGPDGVADFYNQRWVEYSGLTPDALKGGRWGLAVHPEDVLQAQAAWRHSLATGEPYTLEFRFRSRSGTYRWFLARAVPVRDSGGNVVKWFGTTTDIDDPKQAERRQHFLSEASKTLSSSLDYEATLRRVVELAVPRFADWAAVDMLDASGGLHRLAVSHQDPAKVRLAHALHLRYPVNMADAHGLPQVLRTGEAEWMADVPDSLLVASARDEAHLAILRELGLRSYVVVPLKARERVLGALTVIHAESGNRYTEADVQLLQELASRAALAVENARLFQEVRHLNATLEQRVKERTAELQEANRELESFSYSVSHDLRAPLRHIAGFAQLLLKRTQALDETARGYARTISEAAQEGGQLVDELLAFSRMGRAELRQTAVDLPRLLAEVRQEVLREAPGRDIEWRVDVVPQVQADPSMLRLVLRNLLSNAVKYTRPTPRAVVEVSAEEGPSETSVRIRDNGVGFDMRYADKLFGVFQRLHTAEQFEGTGIGLANVRRIIQRHGGRVWAEGVVGQGATFHFTLPRSASRESSS